MRFSCLLLVIALLVSGCAEYAEFRSEPPGARLYINDNFVGLTPIEEYRIPRGEVERARNYRFELTGYTPETGKLQPSVAPGRVVAAVFTMCISCAFRGFYYFKPVDVALTKERPESVATGGARGAENNSPTERLQKLDEAFSKGLITADEYHKARGDILKDFRLITPPHIGHPHWSMPQAGGVVSPAMTAAELDADAALRRLATVDVDELTPALRAKYDAVRDGWRALRKMTADDVVELHLAACKQAGRELTADEMRALLTPQ